MYLRTTTRKRSDGTTAEYLQLAHNYRDPETGRPKPRILFHFGPKDQVDADGLRRLVRSIGRFLGADDELAFAASGDPQLAEMRFLESLPMGSAWMISELWKKLGIGKELTRLAKATRTTKPDEVAGTILGMVLNRCLDPRSKAGTPEWLEQSVWASEVPDALYDEKLYRAMDFLLETDAALQKKVFFSTADLLSLEVDLLLYDTTSSYFEMEWDDEERQEREARWEAFERGEGPEPSRPRPQVVNDPPLRMHGHSKDHRPDLAQVVVGMAVTREGIPVRCWTFEGNRNDAATIEQVKTDLAGWRLNRVVWAVDRGMISEENLLTLRRGGAHYIAGEKMRSGKESVEEALSRPGRYKTVRDNLEVKEVVVGTGERRRRYVVVRNPSGEVRDQLEREGHLKRLETALARLPENPEEYTKEVHRLVAHRTLGRYLRLQKGRPVLDRKKIKSEERLDGKYLLVTSDDSLSPEDVALGYKQLLEVERAWRDMKSGLDLRPMHHRKAERIRAHVLLCWLALLLVRVIETRTGRSWPRVRQEMDRLHNGIFENDAVRVVRRTETTPLQSQLLKALEIAPPPLLESIEKKRRGDPKSAS